MRGSIYVGLIDDGIRSYRDPKPGFWECVHKSSASSCICESGKKPKNTITYFIAPAAVLGPNHCPTSFPRSFPANAIRWTLNGHSGEGESKNHVISWIYVA